MAPLKESFGVEWVEMDDSEKDGKDKKEHRREAPVKLKNGGPAFDKLGLYGGDKSQDKLLNNASNVLVCPPQNIGKTQEMHSSKHGFKDIPISKERGQESSGWGSRGKEKKPPLLKRVMSEARFMQGQVTASKRDDVQEELNRKHYSKAKKGSKSGDMEERSRMEGKRENSEETVVEVEVTIKKWSSMDPKDVREQEETLIVCVPPRSLSDTQMNGFLFEALVMNGQVVSPELHPMSIEPKKDIQVNGMHQNISQAPPWIQQHKPPEPNAVVILTHGTHASESPEEAPSYTLDDEHGMPLNRAKAGSTSLHSRATDMEEKPAKVFGEACTEAKSASKLPPRARLEDVRRSIKPLEVVSQREELSLQREQRCTKQAHIAAQLEVEEVECECCGVGEECTRGYIEHVKELFSGHWVCGLCAEAVHEERHRLGRGVPMEEAVRTHMNMCKQFSSKKKAGEPPQSPGVAHAVCHLLSRHLSDPANPREPAAGAAPVRPFLSRTSSCLPSLSQNRSCSSS